MLAQLNQGLAVLEEITAGPQHAFIAVDFDGATKPAQLPPQWQVPRHDRYRHECAGQQLRVTGKDMRLHMSEGQLALARRCIAEPFGHYNAGLPQAKDSGP